MGMTIFTQDSPPPVDWRILANLLERAGLSHRDPGTVEHSYRHSTFCWWGFSEGNLIATARAISDLTSASYLADVVVCPDYQGRGYGNILMQQIMATLLPYGKIFIYSVPDKIEFYQRYNFQTLTTGMVCAPDQTLFKMRENGYIR